MGTDVGGAVAGVLARLYEREKATGFPSLSGAVVEARVPLTQAVVDDLLLAGRPADPAKRGAVQRLRLLLLDTDRIALEITVRAFLFNVPLRFEATVHPEVRVPSDPRLHLTLTSGGLSELALNLPQLPDWIQVEGRQVALDLGLLLRRGGLDWLIPLVRVCRANVRPGVLYWDLALQIDDRKDTTDGELPR
ncbi:MAG TPA: hypothetical protein VM490_01900 [Armatimonadaceae bacterium]|nr:hypothetical protein [Armatimonadaceae bacterium]